MTWRGDLWSVTLPVEGMTCGSCVQTIQQQIGKKPGIIHIEVSLEHKHATVIYDKVHHSLESLVDAIEDMGFESSVANATPAMGVPTERRVFPMDGCVPEVLRDALARLSQLKGVLESQENPDGRGLAVTFAPALVSAEQVAEVLSSLAPVTGPTTNTAQQEGGRSSSGVEVVKMRVEGMVCLSCTTTIEGKIGKLKGVEKIKVGLESQEATVVYLPYLISVDEIIKQIGVAGFKAFVKSKARQLQLSTVDRLLNATCHAPCSPEEGTTKLPVVSSTTSTTTALIDVTGMHCNSCVVNIQDNIAKMIGVSSVHVSLEKGQAVIQHDPSSVTAVDLQKAIEALPPGKFRARLAFPDAATRTAPSEKSSVPPPDPAFLQPLATMVQIHIEGMTCNSCVQTIQDTISQRKGVRSAQVSLANHRGTFEYDPLVITPEELRTAIEEMGFDAFLPETNSLVAAEAKSPPSARSSPSSPALSHIKEKEAENDVDSSTSSHSKCFIQIGGMTCASCVANIERNLKNEQGVHSVLVALMASKAEVRYSPMLIDPLRIAECIRELGFTASVMENYDGSDGSLELVVRGMTCASCVHKIESNLMKRQGIIYASVALATNKAHVKYDPEVTGPRDIIRLMEVRF